MNGVSPLKNKIVTY